MVTFFGHELWPGGITANVLWAFSPLIFLALAQRYEAKKNFWVKLFFSGLFVLTLPNSLYLFLEIKHIVMVDGIADDNNLWALQVFSILSITGLFLTIIQIRQFATKIGPFNNFAPLTIVILSAVITWGAVLAENTKKIFSYDIFLKPKIIWEMSTTMPMHFLVLFFATTVLCIGLVFIIYED